MGVAAAALLLLPPPSQAGNLLGYYEFEGNKDNSAGTAGPATGGTSSYVTGFRGQGLDHGGIVGDVVSIPVDINPASLDQVSFGGWINVDTAYVAPNTGFEGFLASDNGGWDRGITVNKGFVNPGPGFGIASGEPALTTTVPTVGTWQYVVGTFNKTNNIATVYVGDDVAATQTTDSASRTDAASGASEMVLELGAYDNQFLNGQTDDIFIFDCELTLAQVNAIRNLRLSSFDSSPADCAAIFALFDSSSTGNVAGINWTPVSGLTAGEGQLEDLGPSGTAVVLDGSGNGMVGLAGIADGDGDGMDDAWETSHFGDLSRDGTLDNDTNGGADGLTDLQEFQNGTNPNEADTDGDGLNDGAEVNTHLTDPTKADTDSDGLNDGDELNLHSTDPLVADSDSDGLNDGPEVNTYSTDPNDDDSDNDTLLDGAEVNTHLTDPNIPDSDGDGIDDGNEVAGNNASGTSHGYGPTDPTTDDSDGDGLTDPAEIDIHLTDPNTADSDGDGFSDFDEINAVPPTDPNDINDFPPPPPVTLLAYYEFEGNKNNSAGTAGSATGGTTSYVTGFRGQGLDHAGVVGDVVNIPVDINPATHDKISFGGWINVDDDAAFDGFLGSDDGGWDRGLTVNRDLGTPFAPGFGVASGGAPELAATTPVNGTWQYVVGTFDKAGNLATVYAGDDVATTQTTATATSADAATIGGSLTVLELGTYDNQFLDGQTDDIFIFEGVLDAHQVNAIRNLRLSSLDLSPADCAEVFALFESGGNGLAGGVVWSPISGLDATNPGAVTSGGGSITVVLNDAGDGLTSDSDGDGLPDDWEQMFFGDLDEVGSGDPDADSLTNADEYLAGSNPTLNDTDGDLLLDGAEVHLHGSDPLLVDTDGDSLSDFDEVNTHATDPTLSDTDGDELTDADEILNHGTDPLLPDTDGDGANDGLEILHGFDPNNASSTPPPGLVIGGLAGPGSVGKFVDGVLPPTTPVVSTGDSWTRVTALPNVSFGDAMGLQPEPRTNNLVVYERGGRLQQVEYNAATSAKSQIMDMSSLVATNGLGGLMTMVFHPDYNLAGSPNKDYIYVFYTTTATAARGFTEDPDGSLFIRISRFTRNPATGTIPISSEQVLIQQIHPVVGFSGFVHIAGGMTFGTDGFLYISWGDNEHAPNNVVPGIPFYQDSQRVDRVFQCAIIAIDVDSQGGAVSTAPARTLQGSTGPNGVPGASQSCPPGHPWYHADNFSGIGYHVPRQNYFHRDNNIPPPGTAGTSQGYIYYEHSVSGNRTLVNYNYDAHGAALEEHVALGMRNGWKLATDPVDGDIGIFEVGSNSNDRSRNFEEFNVLKAGQQGANFGWPYREGNVLQEYETGISVPPGGNSGAPVYLGVETDPVFAYSHTTSPGGRSASGGVFYRGTRMSSLVGKMVGGDHDGNIWSVDYKSGGTPVVNFLLGGGTNIRHMSPSPDGEDILWVSSNQIHRLVDVSATTPEPPATLSATGAFANLGTLEPRDGMISYGPIAPLWSDRAIKYRYMAVPNDLGVAGEYDDPSQKITFSETGPWQYPRGTVFVKHFSLPLDEGDPDNPATLHKLETRFLVHGDDGEYYTFTYRWRDDQTDADLIPPGDTSSFQKSLLVTRADNSTYTQTWDYPTRTQCFDCHQSVAGTVLGLRARQLNNVWDYSHVTASSSNALLAAPANQLATLDQLGVLDQDLTISEISNYLTSAHISDETATLEHRVMSYLDSNCSVCHQPGGTVGRAEFDALLTTPLAQKMLINAPPKAGSLGLIDPYIVKPGDPVNSLLYHRDASVDPAIMMPPLAKTLTDDEYLDVLYRWIERIGYANFDAHATATGLIGGLHDDDDGDGMSNGLEFYLGTDPSQWTAGAGFAFQQNGGVIEAHIPVNGDAVADGIVPSIEDSVNLVDWYAAGTTNSILTLSSDSSGPGVSGTQVWEVLPGHPAGFMRMGLQP